MTSISYTRLKDDLYRLDKTVAFDSPITGHEAMVSHKKRHSRLYDSGRLVVYNGFEWDMASGAIDTPDMAYASIAHDALCDMVNLGKIPESEQRAADKYFREVLKEQGCSFFRRWYAYLAIRVFQTLDKS